MRYETTLQLRHSETEPCEAVLSFETETDGTICWLANDDCPVCLREFSRAEQTVVCHQAQDQLDSDRLEKSRYGQDA